MKGKFIKKLTAYAVVAAMVVSTPLSASASEFSDNFWVSDGTDENNPNPDNEPTGTVSRTGTGTDTTVLAGEEDKIIGLAVTPTSVVTKVGEQVTLQAQLLTEGDIAEETLNEITRRIKWRSSDMWTVSVAAKTVEGMDKCTITGKKNGFATVTAGLDIDNDGTDDYVARVNVMVGRSADDVKSITWNWEDQKANKNVAYVKHVYDLKDYVQLTLKDGSTVAADTTDDITFALNGLSKYATLSDDGMLTVKAVSKKPEEKGITITAKYGSIEKSIDVTIDAGTPAKKISLNETKGDLNFNNNNKAVSDGDLTKDLMATIQTVGDAATTDSIKWTSSNTNIVNFKLNGVHVADVTTEYKDIKDNKATVTISAHAVGKAKIVATTTSNKKATFNLTVKADLISIDSIEITNTKSYSGKTETITVNRTPAQNVDKLKITEVSSSKAVKIKNYNVTFANDLSRYMADDDKVTLTFTASESKKNGKTLVGAPVKVTVEQSNFKIGKVTNSKAQNVAEKANKTQKANVGDKLSYHATVTELVNPIEEKDALEAISWTSSNEKVAKITGSGKIEVVGIGSANITASSVYKNGKSYKVSKIQFKVKATPACEEIVLKSNTAAVEKGKAFTIQVSKQLPAKAADSITWYVNGVKATTNKPSGITATDKKLTYKISNEEVGSIISVLAVARTSTGANVAATATVYVVDSLASKVAVKINSGSLNTLTVGKSATISGDVTPKSTSATTPEKVVKFTTNKAGIVKIGEVDDKGTATITAVGEGKVTVTAVTASGKTGKVTITVTNPAN